MKCAQFNRHLSVARPQTELNLTENIQDDDFYTCTPAGKVILYKGLIMRDQLKVRVQTDGGLKGELAGTGTIWVEEILNDFYAMSSRFWLVKPKAAELESLLSTLKKAA